jgi:hypothetical protein
MRIRSIALSTLLASLSLSAFAAETNSFDVIGRGNLKTATVTYSIDKVKEGLRARAIINRAGTIATTIVTDYKVTPDANFLLGTSTVRDAAQTTFAASKARGANTETATLTISVVLDKSPLGRRDLKLTIPSYLILFPDDPSVWQILADTATAHPHADNVYYVLALQVDARTHDHMEAFTWNAGGDKTGTLDGKPITLQHFALRFKDNSVGNIYTDAAGKIMQVEAPYLGVKQIRTNFALDK